MNYNRYKDCCPEQTVQKIKKFLNCLNIVYKESELNNPVPFIYSVTVECSSLNIKSHGKGTTKEYCLASAYGELLEKLLNGVFKLRYISVPRTEHRVNIFYDEIPYSISKELSSLPQCIKDDLYTSFYESDGKYPSMEELITVYQHIYGCDNINAIPFYDILSDSVVYLPYNILDDLSHSTGMSYGNTLEEATSQAICEIFERYASSVIIDELLTPPEISIEYIKHMCPKFCDIIDFIYKNGYELTFYDCSLGIGLPVVGLLIVNKTTSEYKINFGSHISFAIAVERCLTEILQGFDKIEAVNFIEFAPSITDNYKEFLYKRFRHNNGPVPIDFFKKVPSWEFKPWDYKFNNNKDIVKLLVDISLTISPNVYIRNNTCMGLTAVRVYIPKLSHYKNAFSIGTNTCISPVEKYNLENFEYISIDKEELDSYERIIKNNFNFLEDRIKYSKNILLSAIEYDKGDILSSINYLRSDDNLPIFAKILLQILILLEKKYSEENIHSILLKFYNYEDIQFTYNLLSGKSLFEEILKARKYTSYSKEYCQLLEKNVLEFIKNYIERMKDNPVDQYKTRELFVYV